MSTVTGVSAREAGGRLALGRLLRGAVQLGGATGPEPFPRVVQALNSADLAVDAAAVIANQCRTLSDRGVPADAVAEAEQTLVDETVTLGLSADQTARLAVHLRELLDPDGAVPRDEAHQRERSLTFSRSGDGMIRGRFALTPEQGGPWLSAIAALQSPRTSGPRFVETPSCERDAHSQTDAGDEADAHADGDGTATATAVASREDAFVAQVAVADTRTTAQKNVDTVTELIARAAGAPDMPRLAGATTTMNVHVALADLEAGRGVGWIDGIDKPVPVSAIEQMRCHSPFAAIVFGEGGEVLHLGKTRRVFSPAQNRALAARDGGCVWPGCERPPSWCESHHVSEWISDDHPPGRTDVENGALLCHFHHRHLHTSDWKLIMLRGVPHLVPPRWRDIEQTPIPTTRRRTTIGSRQRPAA